METLVLDGDRCLLQVLLHCVSQPALQCEEGFP